ncbi:jacalin-related lectin 3 isoform X1 [Asparagus officinalis]|uniref:jacalin-related lectin 3 isoform X1 n=1 Tax=Asparagus officinalis TaxID=4686 RepID=UPI00098E352F|nr:jacalin-related lectin 3 isoform X1 [Asparagus officinalis]
MSYKYGNERCPISAAMGGHGGSPWDDGVHTGIRKVVVGHGASIDSIQVEYECKGSSVWSEKHGGSGGTKTDKVKLVHPHEVLTSITGYYGSVSVSSPVVIRSLTFTSNIAKYGPFGLEQGIHFSFPMIGDKIVGFHGSSGRYLDSIGFYLNQAHNPTPSKALVPSQRQIGYNVVEGTASKGYNAAGGNLNVISNKYTWEASSDEEFNVVAPKKKVVSFPRFTTEKRSSSIGGPVPYGPWGGSGGTIFDDGIYTGVRQINLSRNAAITSLKVKYDRNGQEVWGNKQGGTAGIITDKIIFDYPFEVLTYITGYFGPTMMIGPTTIRSLTFHTTRRKYGPYGDEEGTFFSSCLAEGMVIGFHGRSGWYIHSIGVYVLEGKLSLPQTPGVLYNGNDMQLEMYNYQQSNKLVSTSRGNEGEVTFGVVKEPVPCGPGPWGGDGGKPWDDGVYTGIRQIYITIGDFINSIQLEYDRGGQSVWSTRHGSGGEKTIRIKFDYPNEVLNCISGYISSIASDGNHSVVKSLTFHTTRGKYGPFGEELGTYFTSMTTQGKVVGFHGRCGLYLDAIGVHMQHWLGERKQAGKSILSKYFF